MTEEAPKKLCKNCEWWSGSSHSDSGECRVEPPKIVIVNHRVVTQFPKTNKEVFCSKFTQKAL